MVLADGVPRGNLAGYSTKPIEISGKLANLTAGFAFSGIGFSAASSATGTYEVTFQDYYPVAESFIASVQGAVADDLVIVVGPYDAAAKELTIYCWDLSEVALADPDFDSGDYIHFIASFDNSGVWA